MASIGLVLAVSGCSSSMAVKDEAPSQDAENTILTDITGAGTPSRAGFGMDKPVLDNEGKPISDEEVARLLDWHVAVPRSAHVALLEARAFREYYTCHAIGDPSRTTEGNDWAVHPSAPEDVNAVRPELLQSSCFESVSTVPQIFLPAHADLGRCRYAAARANADLVLLYAKATRVIRYRNKLANFYPLIIGLVLPGEETTVVTRVEGALIDARTGRVFAVAQGSSRGHDSTSPLAASDEARHVLLDGTEHEALIDLARNIRGTMEAAANRIGKKE
jgi:hypothetical protein